VGMRSGARPSHATVVAYLALFIALATGSAVAAKKIGSGQLKKNAVKTKKIANKAVTDKKLADAAVTSDKLADASVVSDKLAQDSVATGKIQRNAVTQGKLADDSVGSAQLLADSIGTNKIRDAAVTPPKVANGLGLEKVAAVVATASADPPNLPAGTCEATTVTVPGLEAGDSILVLPRPTSASHANVAPIAGQVDPAGPFGDELAVVFCNGGDAADPPAQPITIAAFR
jgi:hypothetical protein